MASIIDGTTYEGFWKLTADDASPNEYTVAPKGQIYFFTNTTTSGAIYFNSDYGKGTSIILTTATTIDENGNALATSAAVADYLSRWR